MHQTQHFQGFSNKQRLRSVFFLFELLWLLSKTYQNLLKLLDYNGEVAVSDSYYDDFLLYGDDMFGEKVFGRNFLDFLWVDDFEHLSQTRNLGLRIAEIFQKICQFLTVL